MTMEKKFVLKVVYATWFDEKVAQMLDQVENFRHVGSILCSHNKNRTVVFDNRITFSKVQRRKTS